MQHAFTIARVYGYSYVRGTLPRSDVAFRTALFHFTFIPARLKHKTQRGAQQQTPYSCNKYIYIYMQRSVRILPTNNKGRNFTSGQSINPELYVRCYIVYTLVAI